MTKFDEFHLPDTVKDVGIAIGSVAAVFLLTFVYSGNWPPMVVIESGSMEHDNNSLYAEPGYTHLGTIDTLEIWLLSKKLERRISLPIWKERTRATRNMGTMETS